VRGFAFAVGAIAAELAIPPERNRFGQHATMLREGLLRGERN
jgi:hypothetical protein